MDRIKGRIKFRGDIGTREIEETYRKAFVIPSPKTIQRLLLKLFGMRVSNPLCLPFLFADSYYKEASPNTINQILRETKEKFGLWVYKEEEADCDDATFWLMGVFHQDKRTIGMPIYITWTGTEEDGHSLLSYYFRNTVTMIEPQNYSTFGVPSWQLWTLIG